MEESIEARCRASLKTAQNPVGRPFPAYSAGKSWDEIPGKTSSGKKFHCNVPISSEQQLVDSGTVDPGCNGELTAEGSYPYTATDGTCNLSGCQVGIPQGGVVGYTDVFTDSEQAMMSAVAQQPMSIAIEADQYSFQLYSSGVFIASCGTRLDHGVLAVVYGSEAGTDYRKVKNSRGSSWGEQGYVRLQRGKGGMGEMREMANTIKTEVRTDLNATRNNLGLFCARRKV